jgi:transcriptional regulator with XRE-family HTH domain
MKLLDIRKQRKLTQEQLAEKSGVTQETISAIELGKIKNPSYKIVISLAKALRVPALAIDLEESK